MSKMEFRIYKSSAQHKVPPALSTPNRLYTNGRRGQPPGTMSAAADGDVPAGWQRVSYQRVSFCGIHPS